MSQIFAFQSRQVRTIAENETIWFAAKDVCAALGISWSSATLKPLPSEWKGVMNFITPSGNYKGGGKQRLSVITEPGLYMLAFRSNKDEAVALTRWVAGEVLPAIRKTGKFEAALERKALPAPEPETSTSIEADLRTHFAAIHFHVKNVHEHERAIYDLVRQQRGKALATPDAKRSALVNMNTVMDALWYTIDHALEAAEFHAKSMCIMARV